MLLSKSIRNLFESLGGGPYETVLLPAMKRGDLVQVSRYLVDRRNHPRHRVDVQNAFTEICQDPLGFKHGGQTLRLLMEHGVVTASVFAALERDQNRTDTERRFWTSYAIDPSPENADTLSVLLAEYIRYRMGTDPKGYQMDVPALLPNPSLTHEFAKGVTANSLAAIKAVQHQLVQYVTTEGKDLPLNRGAALLAELRDAQGAELWQRPITDFKERRREGLTSGTVIKYAIRYE